MVLEDEIRKWSILQDKPIEDKLWLDFRSQIFPYERLNLNSSTFGSPSVYIKQAAEHFLSDETEGFPLRLYQLGREEMKKARNVADELWGSESHHISVSQSSTQAQNLLLLNILLLLYQEKIFPPFTVLTTSYEHLGGSGFFLRKDEMETHLLSDEEVADIAKFKKKVREVKPIIFFASHLTYNLSTELPVEEWSAIIKEENPKCIIIADLAQSIGLAPLKLNPNIDLAFASAHKWLFGPYGLGFIWIAKEFLISLKGVNWNGELLDPESVTSGFEIAGGQAFASYASLRAALLLYSSIGVQKISERSAHLTAYFAHRFNVILEKMGIQAKYSGMRGDIEVSELSKPENYSGYFCIHFTDIDSYPVYNHLNQIKIHVKCIKNERLNLLRIGIPYYESKERLDMALARVQEFFLST